MDTNKDGKLQRSEAPERMARFFDRLDTNGDDVLDAEELKAMSRRGGNRGDPPPTRTDHDDPPMNTNGPAEHGPSTADPQDQEKTKTETKTKAETEVKSETKAETQDEKKTETKQDESKDETKAETKDDAKVETKVETQDDEAAKKEESTAEVQEAEAVSETTEVRTEEPQEAVKTEDLVTGLWEGSFESEQFSADFTMSLKLGDDGKTVTGSIESSQGDSEISDGKFDAATNKITLTVERNFGAIEYEATITGSKMTGDFVAGGGMFSADFQATRVSDASDEDDSTEQAESKRDDKYDWKSFSELIPAPRWVSSIEASRFEAGRAYVTLDGHRFDDDEPYIFTTEDFGKSWLHRKSFYII